MFNDSEKGNNVFTLHWVRVYNNAISTLFPYLYLLHKFANYPMLWFVKSKNNGVLNLEESIKQYNMINRNQTNKP